MATAMIMAMDIIVIHEATIMDILTGIIVIGMANGIGDKHLTCLEIPSFDRR